MASLANMSTHTEPALKRRAFLGMAAGGAAAIAVPGIARAARSAGPSYRTDPRRLDGAGPRPVRAAGPAGEAFYTIARRLFDPRFDGISPAGIAYVHERRTTWRRAWRSSASSASRCRRAAAGTATPATRRSTGLVIDVSPDGGGAVFPGRRRRSARAPG